MEKVNARSSVSKQNNIVELKSKQDAGIKYNRFPKYKPENVLPRPDTKFKSNPLKSRESANKRHRARNGASCEEYGDEVILDVERRERHKLKNVNLNYLLNFTLSPLDGSTSQRPVRNYKTKFPKYNKEQFLQANCQFIARDDRDYSLHSKNPDILVDWSLIEEVRVPSQELPSCPICLFSPVAAKITRCGHIYCWPCILHYLALTDKSWQKCPICFEAIHRNDLRSVSYVSQNIVNSGSILCMRLMKREKGLMFPVPVAHENPVSLLRVHDAESVTKYQKLLLANKMEIQEIINRERKELEVHLLGEKNEPEACFIVSALKLLDEREAVLTGCQSIIGSVPHQVTNDHMEKAECGIHPEIDNGNMPKTDHNDVSPVGSICTGTSGSFQNNGKGTFYFYQADDGQCIYLHALNVKMLVKEFGSLENSPPIIEGRVLELDKVSMTECVRNRFRYLQHIPLTCEFQVAELDIDPYLSRTTIREFSGDIAKRCRLRKKKAYEEKKREEHIKEIESMKLGKYPCAKYNLQSPEQFPICKNASSNEPEYEVQYPSFGLSNLTLNENEEKSDPPAASFAAMLRDGHVSFNHNAPLHQRTAPQQSAAATDNVSDEDEAASVPEYRQSFSSAIQAAWDIAINQNVNGGDHVTTKKKKKAKNRILFSTSMNRNK